MPRFARPAQVDRGFAAGAIISRSDTDIYDRYATRLYRQALFTLGDQETAEQVVSDIIVSECLEPAGTDGERDAAGRLAVAAYWRYMEIASSQCRTPRDPAPDPEDCAGSARLPAAERAVLGMMLFGGLRYQQVGAGLGISAAEVAALLRSALSKAAAESGNHLGRRGPRHAIRNPHAPSDGTTSRRAD